MRIDQSIILNKQTILRRWKLRFECVLVELLEFVSDRMRKCRNATFVLFASMRYGMSMHRWIRISIGIKSTRRLCTTERMCEH